MEGEDFAFEIEGGGGGEVNGDDRCETPWIFLTTGCYRFLKLSHNLTSSKCAISPIRGRTPSRHLHGYSYFKARYLMS